MTKEVKVKTKNKYDYSIKNKAERAEFVENKLDYIFKLPPHVLMGYSGKDRDDNHKYNKIPKMLDRYTTYFLESRDIESSAKSEYRYYIDRHDEMLRKKNIILYEESYSFGGGKDKNGNDLTNYEENYIDEKKSFNGYVDYGFENIETVILKYAISKKMLSKKEYREILSVGARILIESRDEELKEMIEQIVFNCALSAQDNSDTEVLKEYLTGATIREVGSKLGISHTTVKRKMDNMLAWA